MNRRETFPEGTNLRETMYPIQPRLVIGHFHIRTKNTIRFVRPDSTKTAS